MNLNLFVIAIFILLWNVSCCGFLPLGADTVDEYQNFTRHFKDEPEIQLLLERKKLNLSRNLSVIGGNCSSELNMDFEDEKTPSRPILYTIEETFLVARVLQKVSREQKYPKKIYVVERSTENVRYIVGPCGRYLEIIGS